MQHPSYFLWCTPPSSTFIKSFIYFYSFHKIVGHLLGPRSFDGLEGPLARKQASFSITFGGVELISTSIFAPTAYLGNWALVTSIITARFIIDQRPFLLEALTWDNNNTSRQHVIFLPPPSCACLLPFEQLIGQQMVQFQDSILEHLHHRTFSIMFFDETSGPIVPKFYHVLAQGWALNLQLNQSSQPFDYFPHFFAQHFVHDFDYPIPQLQASLDVCAHIPSTLWVSTSYIVLMATNALEPMM